MAENQTNPNTPVNDAVGDFKTWWNSKTIWGSILMLISLGVKTFWPEVDVQGAFDTAVEGASEVAVQADAVYDHLKTDVYSSISGIIGFLLTVYGRIKAKLNIK